MITKEELLDGISLYKLGEPTPEKMIRLSAYYTVYEHLFGEDSKSDNNSSDFQTVIKGKDADRIISIMGELMETIRVVQPRIYDSVMRRMSKL